MSRLFFLLLGVFAASCAADPPPESPSSAGGASAGPNLGGSSATQGGAVAAPPSVAGSAGSNSGRAHGALQVMGTRILDGSGSEVQLRGMSLFWSQWSNYYRATTVDQLADDWSASVVRAVLGVENGGYLDNQAANEAKVVTIVKRAIERDMYVIIDWHDHHAESHQQAAIDFFTRMANMFGKSPNVIFEIYNEPLKIDWTVVKSYAEPVIAAIRATGSNNLVIVGTPNWSQDVDVAALNPITTSSNVAYTLHFYAATHKQYLRDKAQKAIDAGVALFVTEWGSCESSGDGMLNQAETKTWLDFLGKNHISWVNWSLNDKAEACSALTPSAGTNGPWTTNLLTASGALVKPLIP